MALRKQPDLGELHTVPDIAKRSKVSVKTIRRALDDTGAEALAYVTIRGQIRIPELFYQDWLRRNTHEARL